MIQYDGKGKGIPVFPDHARVCFMGDSLTSCGTWLELIFEYYTYHLPEKDVKIFNNAVGGSNCRYGYAHRFEDAYSFDPTDIVLVYTVNDFGQYSGNILERQRQFYDDMKILCDDIVSRGIRLWFCSEFISPRDLGSEFPTQMLGAQVIQSLAADYHTAFTNLTQLMLPIQEKQSLFDGDRVHLNRLGETVVAKLFLHSQGFDGFDPYDDSIFDPWEMTNDGMKRWFFDNRLRKVWFAELLMRPEGNTPEEKMAAMKKLYTSDEGRNLDDLRYFRVTDYLEIAPYYEQYQKDLEYMSDYMIQKALREKNK